MTNLLVLLALITSTLSPNFLPLDRPGDVRGSSDYLSPTKTLETRSSFTKKEITEKEIIKYKTQYKNNSDLDVDREKTIQEGADGERTNTFEVTSWQGKDVDKKLTRTEVKPSQDKIVELGTRYSWKETNVNGSEIRYWKKMNVWATSYDAHCQGCTGRTWAGTEVKIGTCAVDPKIITLGTSFYVPRYGRCHAEDIGGAIKGKKIDLGFPDVKSGFWSARHVDIYLLDGEPRT